MPMYGITLWSCHSWLEPEIDAFLQDAIVSFVSHCSMVDPPQAVCTSPIGGGGAPPLASSSERDSPK